MSKNAAARMTETAAPGATETIENAAFEAPKADQFRAFAEKGIEQSKEAYARLKNGAETTQKALESSLDAAKAASGELSLKTIAAMRANSDAAFSHVEALVRAKSLAEVIELQTSFVRKRFEAAVEQGKDFQASANKAAEDVARPVRDVFSSALKELKVA